MADGGRSISIGRDVIRSVLATGDHARIFVGPYEPIAASYIEPWPLYDHLGLDDFVGREWLTADFGEFIDTHQSGYFLLEAAAGVGKTAFLAWLARERGYVHHFVELAPSGQAGVAVGLRNLAAQLVRAWELDPDLVEASLPAEVLRPQFLPSILREAAEARDRRRPGQRIVLLVDGLDGADRPPGQNNLGLPRQLPAGVYVLASQRPSDVTLQVDTPRRVLRLAANDWRNLQDMRAFLQRAARRNGAPDVDAFVDTLLERCRGVWIYLACVLGEIDRGQRTLGTLDELPIGLWQYYAQHWRRWRDEHAADWDRVHLPLLATLGAAVEELPFELLSTLAGVAPPPRRLLDEEWRPFLIVGSGKERRYSLYHASLREFLHGQADLEQLTTAEQAFVAELEDATAEAHGRIADRYLRAWGGLENGLPGLRDPATAALDDRYGLRHLTVHLAGARGEDLHRVLAVEWSDEGAAPRLRPRSRNAWHQAAERAGDSARYLDDVALAWRSAQAASSDELEQGMAATSLGRELRYALIIVSIHSVAANVPPPLITALVEKGRWTAPQGLASARQVPEPRRRAESLTAVASFLTEPALSGAMREALAAVRTIGDGPGRAEALASLAPHLPSSLRDEALAVAEAIGHRQSRAGVLVALAAVAAEPARTEVLGTALATARALDDESARSAALATLAPFLPAPLLGDVLAAAWATEPETRRTGMLASLAPHLPGPLLAKAMVAAEAMEDERCRAEALLALGPYLPGLLLAEAIAAAGTIEHEHWRIHALTRLRRLLSGPTRAKMLEAALGEARMIGSERVRAETLAELGPNLPGPLLAEALDQARAIQAGPWRIHAIGALSSHLPRPLLDEALDAVCRIGDQAAQADTLADLGRHLPVSVHRNALITAMSITEERSRAEELGALAPQLSEPLLAEALTAARTITDEGARTEALSALAPHLPMPLLAEAHAEARLIGDERWRARAVAALAPHLPEPLLADALAAARTITDEDARTTALTALAPQLPEPLSAEALAEALSAAQTMTEDSRAEALAAVAPQLPESLGAEALATARSIGDERWRARAIAALAPHLPEPLLAEALDAAQTLSDERWVVGALAALAPMLPDPLLGEALAAARPASQDGLGRPRVVATLAPHLRGPLLADALEAAAMMGFGPWRAQTLAALAPYLPDALLPQALAAAQKIADEDSRAEALAALAPHIPGALLAEALAAARTVGDGSGRIRALAPLIPSLAEPERVAALAETERAIRTIRNDSRLAMTVGLLAPYLPGPHLAMALDRAGHLGEERWRAEALAALAPYLPQALLADALAAARTISQERWRAQALSALAPRLPRDLLADALTAAGSIADESDRAAVLAVLATLLAAPPATSAWSAWRAILPVLATRRRRDLLADIRSLQPVILALGGQDAVREIVQAVWDVGRWWP